MRKKENINDLEHIDFVIKDNRNNIIDNKIEFFYEEVDNKPKKIGKVITESLIHEEIKEYDDYLKQEINKLKNKNKSSEYDNYIAENLDSSIKYSEYIAENLDKTKAYNDYIVENLNEKMRYKKYLQDKDNYGHQHHNLIELSTFKSPTRYLYE